MRGSLDWAWRKRAALSRSLLLLTCLLGSSSTSCWLLLWVFTTVSLFFFGKWAVASEIGDLVRTRLEFLQVTYESETDLERVLSFLNFIHAIHKDTRIIDLIFEESMYDAFYPISGQYSRLGGNYFWDPSGIHLRFLWSSPNFGWLSGHDSTGTSLMSLIYLIVSQQISKLQDM